MSSVMVFATAVVVALILGRQEARHELSLRLRAHRKGLVPPTRRPPVPLLESLLAVVLGLTFLVAGGAMAAQLAAWDGGAPPEILKDAAALPLAAGAALFSMGCAGLRRFVRG